MADIAAAAGSSEVSALVHAAAAGTPKAVYLFYGDSAVTRVAAEGVTHALVPENRRAFNFESYDGRTTPLAAVIDSLRTPGFFPGPKVVWLRESPVFLSADKRADVTEALLEAWSEARSQDAGEKLSAVLALAGWTDEEFRATRPTSLSKTRLREVFGADLDSEQVAQLDAVHAAAMERGLTVRVHRDDGEALLEFLSQGRPSQTVLVCTASVVDARKRFVKTLRDLGAVVDLRPARERSGALTRETVDQVIERTLRAFGKRLDAAARDAILRRAGADMTVLAGELEKLCLYAGDRAVISSPDVANVCRDLAESWIFDFTTALATRQTGRALPLLRGLLSQGEPPLRLLAMIAREVRMLLVARECLDGTLRGRWRGDLSFNAFQARVAPHVDEAARKVFGNVHPFVLYRRLQDAGRVSSRSLRDAIVQLSDLDLRLKSSRGDPALLLETFVLGWCSAAARAGTTPSVRSA